MYNRQSKVFNIPFLLRLAVAIEEGLFFIIMSIQGVLSILAIILAITSIILKEIKKK